jgi:hypothetical protein
MLARRFLAPALVGATACSEYEFSKDLQPNEDFGDLPEDVVDTGRTDGGGGGGGTGSDPRGGDDTGGTPGDDACWEPEDGYTENPAAKIITTDGATPTTVTFLYSDTDYDNDLYLDAPEAALLARAWADQPDTATQVGPFDAGTELVFGIDVRTTGDHWKSGPASRNDDGVVHVAVTYEGGCSWLVGFEDIRGGGDLDFNDVILRVEGMLRQEQ